MAKRKKNKNIKYIKREQQSKEVLSTLDVLWNEAIWQYLLFRSGNIVLVSYNKSKEAGIHGAYGRLNALLKFDERS